MFLLMHLRGQVELDVLTGALCSYPPVQLHTGLVNPTSEDNFFSNILSSNIDCVCFSLIDSCTAFFCACAHILIDK